ncbi:MAG: iron ABC transporter permease [Candidatus Heimdallarchaeota archaeon]|nr:iron ABC transporter permease [Candidatus Heimdallarchaeota archaeon]
MLQKNTLFKIIYLSLPLGFLLIFFLIPLIHIAFLAFGISLLDITEFTFENLFRVLSHPLNQYFLYWDVQQALLTTIFCVVIGLIGSYILVHYKFLGKTFLRNLFTIPFILPPIVVLIGFIATFGHGSWFNRTWESLTGSILIDIYNTYEGIILAHVFYNIPVIIRLTELGWRSINQDGIAVAKSLGATRLQIFSKIQLPKLLPILTVAALLVFIYAFNSFAIVLVLGGVQYQTLEVRIYSLAKSEFDFSGAAALTLVQVLINLVIIVLYLFLSSKYELPATESAQIAVKPFYRTHMPVKELLGRVLILIYFILVGGITILPITGVILASITSPEGTLTLSNYAKLYDYSIKSYIGLPPSNMILNSLFFGFGVMILATLLALLLNYGLNIDTTVQGLPKISLLKNFMGILVILPLAISSITLAFSLFSLYRTTFIYEQVLGAILIAHTLIAFPFANRVISASRSAIDPSLVSVSQSLGASRLKTFIKIELPLLIPGIIVACLFSFAISIGEFGATSFLAKANFATIPVGIYRLIATRNIGPAASFATILVVITIASFMIIEKLGKLELRL